MKYSLRLINHILSPAPAVLLLLLFSFCRQAAAQITGKVTGASSGDPVPAASVFINNSTYASICDANGFFELKHFPPPPFELTITAVGYEASTLQVTAETTKAPLQVRLRTRSMELEEVTIISPEKNGWQLYGKLFTEEFIGYSPFAQQCKLLNKEVLEFRYNKAENKLMVSATGPLHIQNDATGYEITYWLEDFEFSLMSRQLFFKGYAQYTALQSSREKKNKQWTANRRSAYLGSLNHFMRSVYQNSTAPEGFVIRRMKRISNEEYGAYVPVHTDTFAMDTEGQKRLLKTVLIDTADQQKVAGRMLDMLQWLRDDSRREPYRFTLDPVAPDTAATREFRLMKEAAGKNTVTASLFDKNRLSPADSALQSMLDKGIITMNAGSKKPRSKQLYDIADPLPLPCDSIVLHQDASVRLAFSDYLYIMYTREEEELAYRERQYRGKLPPPAPQASIISLTPGQYLTVSPDGNFYNGYDMMTEAYWSYEKLDKLLPLDYQPPAISATD